MKRQPHATYKFDIDQKKKIIKCFASGSFTKADARAYIREFKHLIATIEGIENYTLIIDVREQGECSNDVNSCINEITSLYSSIPFKKTVCFQSHDPYAFKQITEHSDIRFINTFNLLNEKDGDINFNDIGTVLLQMNKNDLSSTRKLCNCTLKIIEKIMEN